MPKTIKGKMLLVHLCLAIVMIVIGAVASYNLFILNAGHIMFVIILISFIGAAGGFLASTFFTSRILKPIYVLTDSVRKVMQGDFSRKVELCSDDEIGTLSVEYNKMLEILKLYLKSNSGKLMMERNRSLAILKSISEPIIILDTGLKIMLINNASEDFFKIKEREVIRSDFAGVIKNDELISHISSALNDKEVSKEKLIPFNTGEAELYFNVIVTKIRENSNSNITGFVVVFYNVTDLKQLEKIKTDFIATISHEFKTPLTSILMGASLLSDESIGPLNERQKKVLDTVAEDGERLSILVNNLLQLSRMESGKEIYNFKASYLSEITDAALRPMYTMAEQAGVKLYSSIRKDLPMVNVDPEKITWVLNNLITNALKYTKSGDEISINAYPGDGGVLVSVKDTGTGIPPEYQSKIFEKYVQVKGYGLEVRGSGLGLAIVKDIINAHGGNIWCESKPDQGSNFIFSLPKISGLEGHN
ncbi:MAG TPA: ATP-binding protein [Clostridia bacterium]